MTIYVEPLERRMDRLFCRMFADNIDELKIAAHQLHIHYSKLKHQDVPFYVITSKQRLRAVMMGAEEVGPGEVQRLNNEAMLRRRPKKTPEQLIEEKRARMRSREAMPKGGLDEIKML